MSHTQRHRFSTASLCRAVGLIVGLLGFHRDAASAEPLETTIKFNRDIRPILSAKCFPCHGPDAATRKADLRLDDEASVKSDRDGYRIVVPGKPDDSELVRRIVSRDDTERMPPPNADRQLTPAEIELLRRWVQQGVRWEKHWSFIPPQRVKVPRAGVPPSGGKRPAEAGTPTWPRNAIDDLVLARLEQAGLSPSPRRTGGPGSGTVWPSARG